MYRYRNKKTGEIITTTNRVGGKNWEPVEEPSAAEAPAQEAPAEEAPAKTGRKGKK